MKKILFTALLVALAAIALVGCDALIAGTSVELSAARVAEVGTGSINATWTYNGSKGLEIRDVEGDLTVAFSQPVAFAKTDVAATPDNEQSDAVSLKIFLDLGNGMETVLTGDVTGEGELNAAGTVYTLSMDSFFDGIFVVLDNLGLDNTADGSFKVEYSVAGFESKTVASLGNDAVKATIPAVTGKVKVQPIFSGSAYDSVVKMKTGEGLYTAHFPLASAITVGATDLAAFTVSDSVGAKADYAVSLNADNDEVLVNLKSNTGVKKNTMRNVTVTIPNVKINDSGIEDDLVLVFQVLPVTPAWIPMAKVIIAEVADTNDDGATLYKTAVSIKNVKAPAGFQLSFVGQPLYSNATTNSSWNNTAVSAAVDASGTALFNIYFAKDTTDFTGWGRTWDTGDDETVLEDADASFRTVIYGTWDSVIGCWDDKNDGRDGNFFPNFDVGNLVVGETCTMTIDCNDGQDI